ncbi:MAG: DEAD/DEAH box helicase [Alicyclobacillus sp.]|nr:DEAD/DEAH box helicase [Alicyclobacillus sp.]
MIISRLDVKSLDMKNPGWLPPSVHNLSPWSSRFVPSEAWGAPPVLELKAVDLAGSAALHGFKAWLEAAGEWTAISASDCGEGEVLRACGAQVVRILSMLARVPGMPLSREVQLLLRILRLAAVIVSRRDVLAFAAPAGASIEEVAEACGELELPDEGSMGRWTSYRTFVAAWLPGWSDPAHTALRRLFVSEALRLSGSEPSAAAFARADLWVDAWLWYCVDRFVRDCAEVPAGPETEAADEGTTYRILYRGEAEARRAWEVALAAEPGGESARFSADGWLVWRTLKQAFASSGWSAQALRDPTGRAHYHLEFELRPPQPGDARTAWTLEYRLAHNHWPQVYPLSDWWAGPTRAWTVGKDVLWQPDGWMLPKLAEAAGAVPAIASSLKAPRPAQADIPAEDVYRFLTVDLPNLEQLGFAVRVPAVQKLDPDDIRIRVQVQRSDARRRPAPDVGGWSRNWFDTLQLVTFDWKVALGETELSAAEFERMVAERSPLVQLNGSWKLIPLAEVLAQVEDLRRSAEQPSDGGPMDALRLLVLTDWVESLAFPVDVAFDPEVQSLRSWLEPLLQAQRPQPVPVPASFRGTLRGYQQHGYQWLLHLRRIGCGGVLADDMGLGKTIQVLAYWLHLREQQRVERPHLLVCPTSLIPNWRTEMAKFAPALRVYVHHGPQRMADAGALAAAIRGCDVVITTYATAVRDADALRTLTWDSVVVDEAQNIKNPETKQAQVVCGLRSRHRIALTGTPVENRLEELWSICRFAVPGYLGGLAWFRRQFVDPILNQHRSDVSHRLHRVLQPVLLRRTKTDPAIQLQLPEKWEVREYAGLTSEQGALYQSVVNRLFSEIGEAASGMSRRGQILTALVRLKQICDHPCLAVGGRATADRSGKLRLLLDLLADAVDEGEAALVFTQFRNMGEILCEAMEQRFGWRPQFLHGGLAAGARGQLVEAFQSGKDASPVLVLSLKAGGVGLNLTRANHVFHFDRWWNPAVEDQATDRVFRIGQTRNVQVHKLVCPGTLEERIDELIQTKRSLSSAVVGESEGWLTELDNQALRALFELDQTSAVEEGDE